MARARNIKPSFFTNEQVSDNCPLGRLLFIGLWTMADYKGDLEWKEKTLKIQILPWDECSVKQLAINLDKSGLVRFYSDGNKIYLNIPNFEKHQNPHKNERDKGSDIPHYSEEMRQAIDLKGLTINRDLSGLKPECSHSDRADSLLLIPDSPILNPACGMPESKQVSPPAPPKKKYAKTGSRLPDDWRPTQDYVDAAMHINPDYTREWFSATAHKFRDYWVAKTGKDATKADWLATWRNWVRNDLEYNRGKTNAKPKKLDNESTDWVSLAFGSTSQAASSGNGEQDIPFIDGDFSSVEGDHQDTGGNGSDQGGMAEGVGWLRLDEQ